jgi:hypothetical protein
MPPRYAYWTILIDNQPTAFRARAKEELLPTFNQLRRTNRDVVFKWFARGRLWDTPEQATWAAQHLPAHRDKRGREWRPGGQHRDPRQRTFDKARNTGTGEHGDKRRKPPSSETRFEKGPPSSRRDAHRSAQMPGVKPKRAAAPSRPSGNARPKWGRPGPKPNKPQALPGHDRSRQRFAKPRHGRKKFDHKPPFKPQPHSKRSGAPSENEATQSERRELRSSEAKNFQTQHENAGQQPSSAHAPERPKYE